MTSRPLRGRTKIVAGNWKMNKSPAEGESLVNDILSQLKGAACEVIIAPPFTLLPSAKKWLDGSVIKLAAQNCCSENDGAYTGEISAKMIRECGAEYVIIGHSERRKYYNETNALLLKKTERALENGLKVIYCVGETLTERESKFHFDVVQQQLQDMYFLLKDEGSANIIIAYEPVWAIGTGRTASPVQAQEMHAYIRSLVEQKKGKPVADAVRILYGGSCTADNAAELFRQADVDGGLIGGASLKANDFVRIISAAG